jgi:preflagellin peptidase FlaK
MIVSEMLVSSLAVLVTLCYASYLDVRDRRVPFVYWIPMLFVGIPCTGYLLWEKTGNGSLIAGYLSLVAAFLYADYLDNRGRTDSAGLAWYYRKSAVFAYLPVVLVLPVLAWFVLAGNANTQILPWYAMFAGIICYVTYLVYREDREEEAHPKRRRAEPKPETGTAEAIRRWYFVLLIMIFAITSGLLFYGAWGMPALSILFLSVFCGVFYIFGRMHFFGGADAWALIFISFCIPVFPVTPLLGVPPLGFLAFSILINALILNLVAPVGIFLINIVRGNKAPLMYLFFGFPVQGDAIQKSWGFVMEDFEERNGEVHRKFIGFFDSISRMYTGEGRVYTKDLREHPEEYAAQLAMYRKVSPVWISYAVPFIIPITAGLVTAIVFGDFLFTIMKIASGA